MRYTSMILAGLSLTSYVSAVPTVSERDNVAGSTVNGVVNSVPLGNTVQDVTSPLADVVDLALPISKRGLLDSVPVVNSLGLDGVTSGLPVGTVTNGLPVKREILGVGKLAAPVEGLAVPVLNLVPGTSSVIKRGVPDSLVEICTDLESTVLVQVNILAAIVVKDVTKSVVPAVVDALESIVEILETAIESIVVSVAVPIVSVVIDEVNVVLNVVHLVELIVEDILKVVTDLLAHIVPDVLSLVVSEVQAVLDLLQPLISPIGGFVTHTLGNVAGVGSLLQDITGVLSHCDSIVSSAVNPASGLLAHHA